MRSGYAAILVPMMVGCAQVSGFDDLEFVGSSYVSFCNTLELEEADVLLTLALGSGDSKIVFNAATGCCTPCTEVALGTETPALLHYDGRELASTTIPLSAIPTTC